MQNVWIVFLGVVFCHLQFAQTTEPTQETAQGQTINSSGNSSGVNVDPRIDISPEYRPQTSSERLRSYLKSAFGPGAIGRAVVSGGIAQMTNAPKEWGGGAEAYGERVGNSFATHIIRRSLEFGAATALHEDNRYMRSTESGFARRSKHAVLSVFVARDAGGNTHFGFSRIGGAAGASFISRLWQPRSVDTAGDAAVNFGTTMLIDMGWNMFREFGPRRFTRR